MEFVDQTIVKKSRQPELYAYLEQQCQLANNLRNAALFRTRQIFCGYKKKDRTANEKEVFQEIEIAQAQYGISVRQCISYKSLEKLMRATINPDFFAGLPMQSAQHTVKQVTLDFHTWLAALKDYKANPGKYLGKPRMPKYGKSGASHSYVITNQDAVLYPVVDGKTGEVHGSELKLPLLSYRLQLPHLDPAADLRQVEILPYHGTFIVSLIFEDGIAEIAKNSGANLAAIDFGVDNIATIVSTDASCAVFKGGAIKANNQMYAKKKASATAIIAKGHERKGAHSKHLDKLAYDHENFSADYLHKVSRRIVDYCVAHEVGTLVIGKNKHWKQEVNLGSTINQTFVSIPYYRLQSMIRYKAEAIGIAVVEQEESYTSKADITTMDPLPVYKKGEKNTVTFSGTRIQRGLYKCGNGLVINADCNAAANILRKAFPDAWSSCSDFSFLAFPMSFGFHAINDGIKTYKYS